MQFHILPEYTKYFLPFHIWLTMQVHWKRNENINTYISVNHYDAKRVCSLNKTDIPCLRIRSKAASSVCSFSFSTDNSFVSTLFSSCSLFTSDYDQHRCQSVPQPPIAIMPGKDTWPLTGSANLTVPFPHPHFGILNTGSCFDRYKHFNRSSACGKQKHCDLYKEDLNSADLKPLLLQNR